MNPVSETLAQNIPLRVFHLDDDPFELDRLKKTLQTDGLAVKYEVQSFANIQTFRERLSARPTADIVILDVNLEAGGVTGAALVREIREAAPTSVILMCSALDNVATISECLSQGADDFLSKRTDKAEICLRIYHSYQLARLKRGDTPAAKTTASASLRDKPKVVGATFERIAKRVPLIVNSAISAVHIEGESGTGKEVVADLFAAGMPASTPFVRVNCGAIAATLLESELFGHVKGSFTGATGDKKGLIEAANGGWIFLDEVSSLTPYAQVALLRALENHELMRVGSSQPVKVQIRVLSATNEPLRELVRKGRFRQDLWQRLCETEILLAPLRDRRSEIPTLVQFFCDKMPGGPYRVSDTAMEVLCSLSWKNGNVRELRNSLRAMTELHVNKLLTPLALPERLLKIVQDKDEPALESAVAGAKATPGASSHSGAADEIVLKVNTEQPLEFDNLADSLLLELTRKLQRKHGKLSLRKLSKTIGISRSTLSGRMKGLVQKNLIEMRDLNSLVGIGDE